MSTQNSLRSPTHYPQRIEDIKNATFSAQIRARASTKDSQQTTWESFNLEYDKLLNDTATELAANIDTMQVRPPLNKKVVPMSVSTICHAYLVGL